MRPVLLGCLRRAAAALRTVVGAPDYERYVAHLRTRHPDVEPVGWAEFYCSRLEDRYDKPGSKCC